MNDLIEELDGIVGNEPDNTLLLGHSWGGVLGTEYVKRYPQKIKGLVLMATGLNSKQWLLYTDELEKAGKSDISKDELFFTPVEMQEGKKMFEHEKWSGFSGETFDAIFEDYLKSYDLLDEIQNFDLPILNIFGENDLRFSKNVTRSFKKFNPKVKDLEIKNSGHFPYILKINKEIILSEIKEFIKTNQL